MNLSDKEIEDLRACIATEMGYEKRGKWWSKPGHKGGQSIGDFVASLPPYTEKIDSIREAAMERFKGDDARRFQEELDALFRGVATRHEWQLTALDHAIAFARTAKIWRFKV